ncbi:hypothetical protein SAMN03159339_6682 [Variovorax sp. 770b2]|nr:hypothetical protein SAMN03159339_6682 [Variovorax sp. 770b2]
MVARILLLVFLKFIAAIAMLAGLHVGAMAALGCCLGIEVRRISLGFAAERVVQGHG